MCKIQFISGNTSQNLKARAFLKQLNNGERGNTHATGMLALHTEKGHYIAKQPGGYMKFVHDFADKTTQWWLNNANTLIGHNRFATDGSASDNENNHPMTVGDWTIIHNGVLKLRKSGEGVLAALGITEQCESDTYELLNLIIGFAPDDEKNMDDSAVVQAVENALQHFKGSFSIFLYAPNGRLYYFKESVKPYHFHATEFEDGTFIVQGSTESKDMADVSSKYEYRGHFYREVDSGVEDEYELIPHIHTVYVLDTAPKSIEEFVLKAIPFEYESEEGYELASRHRQKTVTTYNQTHYTQHARHFQSAYGFADNTPKKVTVPTSVDDSKYKRNVKVNFSGKSEPKYVPRASFQAVHPELYDLLVGIGISWDRLYFHDVYTFDLDLSALPNNVFNSVRELVMEKDEYILEENNKDNGKCIGIILDELLEDETEPMVIGQAWDFS